MPSHKLNFKLYLSDPATLSDREIVPIFHSWIQSHALADHGLIDVADYAHVHDGPGVVLVSHEANLYLDHTDGKPGLLYQRKQPIPDAHTFPQRLAAVVKYALAAADLLESATGGNAKFKKNHFTLKIADRLNAPNTPDTFTTLRAEIESALTPILGPLKLTHVADPAKLFEVQIG